MGTLIANSSLVAGLGWDPAPLPPAVPCTHCLAGQQDGMLRCLGRSLPDFFPSAVAFCHVWI